jgi:hypothetical protein
MSWNPPTEFGTMVLSPGEEIISSVPALLVKGRFSAVSGKLKLTNYRLVFCKEKDTTLTTLPFLVGYMMSNDENIMIDIQLDSIESSEINGIWPKQKLILNYESGRSVTFRVHKAEDYFSGLPHLKLTE